MADLNKAFEKTMGHEGGYSNHPNDLGGETYRGIARKRNKNWEGWKVADDLKKQHGNPAFRDYLKSNKNLQSLVRNFYRTNYWERVKGDEIPDAEIAIELFDNAVNMGVSTASKFFQQSLNLLNRNGKNYADIKDDGDIGSITLNTLHSFLELESHQSSYLLKVMNVLQGGHYIKIMNSKPEQEVFARGWFNRVSIHDTKGILKGKLGQCQAQK